MSASLPHSRAAFQPSPVMTAVRLALLGVFTAAASGARADTAATEGDTTLPTVEVKGKTEAAYTVKKSSTATKTDTPLRDTPQSITVITKELMQDQGMQTMADALRYVPGIVTAQGEGNRDTAVFRGSNSTGDFFIDGVRDDVQYYRDFYNIERVEALKGSNAMIFGRGGSGGLINRVSKQANWKTTRDASLTLGSWNNRRLTADVGQAATDNVAFRITGLYEDSDSYRDDVSVKRSGINPTLGIKAGANTLINLGYEHFEDERTADRGVPSWLGKPLPTDPSTFFGSPENSWATARVDALSATIDHDFGRGVTLRNRTRYADYDKFYQNVYPDAVTDGGTMVTLKGYNNATQRTNLFNQTDLLFSVKTGPVKHSFATGVELGRQITDNLRQTAAFPDQVSTPGDALVPVSNPRLAERVTFSSSSTDANNHSVATDMAIYLQDQITFSPQWQAILGLRYERFAVDFEDKRTTGAHLEAQDHPLTPRVGLVFKPVEAVSIYGSYSIAFVPRAGDQLSSLSAANSSLEPEEFRNVELGAKWDIRPDLAATAAIYQLERNKVAVSTGATSSVLVDGQRTRGIELGLSGNITKNWNVMGGYAYQDAEYTEAQGTAIAAGATVAQVPDHMLSLWNRYDMSSRWAAALGVVYRGSIYAGNSNTVELPAYTRFDAALFHTFNKKFKAQLNIENLFDTEYYASAHSDNNITPGSPRAVRVMLNASF